MTPVRRRALLATFIVLATGLGGVGTASGYNECYLLHPGPPHYHQAPPCLDTESQDPRVRAVLDPTCAAMASGACPRFYVMILPDGDGDLGNGVQLEMRLVWQESNGCRGLQRIAWPQCNDVPDRSLGL